MDHSTAQALSNLLEDSITSMSQAIALASTRLPVDEYERVKKGIGIPLGTLSHVLDAIYDEHPDLAPPGIR